MFRGVCCIGHNTGTIVGDFGTIFHTTTGGMTWVELDKHRDALKDYLLSQNYPNPFNPSTTIGYCLPLRAHVTLTVYNTLGQQVALLQNGEQDAGYHDVKFNAAGLSSGLYFYRLQTGMYVETKKFILAK
jgi:photosystem II stability/assembly factor-like uncharacterized protein